jgi:hypothetical protein
MFAFFIIISIAASFMIGGRLGMDYQIKRYCASKDAYHIKIKDMDYCRGSKKKNNERYLERVRWND